MQQNFVTILFLLVIHVPTYVTLKKHRMLLPANENIASKLKLTEEENAKNKIEVTEKLQRYLKNHNNARDKWLLSSHAHCFVCLS